MHLKWAFYPPKYKFKFSGLAHLAPQDGFEPPTNTLTACCSTPELLGKKSDNRQELHLLYQVGLCTMGSFPFNASAALSAFSPGFAFTR